MNSFSFLDDAEAEYKSAIAWYEESGDGLGGKFRRAVEEAIATIMQLPRMHPRYEDSEVRQCVLKPYSYSIFYQIKGDQIVIGAVAHHHQKPGYWKDRLSDI